MISYPCIEPLILTSIVFLLFANTVFHYRSYRWPSNFRQKKREVGAVMFLEVESNDRFATGMLRSIQSRLKRPPIPKGASFGFRSPEGLSVFSAIGWSVCTYYVCMEYTVYCLMVEKEHHLLHQHLEHHCHCLSSCLREESDGSPWDRSWVTRTEELLTIHNHLW